MRPSVLSDRSPARNSSPIFMEFSIRPSSFSTCSAAVATAKNGNEAEHFRASVSFRGPDYTADVFVVAPSKKRVE